MENELQYLGEMILKKKHDIAKVVHEDRMSGVPLTQTENEDFRKIEPLILKSSCRTYCFIWASINRLQG